MYIYIAYNKIGNTGARLISVTNFPHLTILYLSNAHIQYMIYI